MRLYRTAKGRWVGTQDDARKDGKGWTQVETPTDKPGLLAFLNDNTPTSASAAFNQGYGDGQRGISANPYFLPTERADWERGYSEAYASGEAPHPSFYVQTRKRVGKERRR